VRWEHGELAPTKVLVPRFIRLPEHAAEADDGAGSVARAEERLHWPGVFARRRASIASGAMSGSSATRSCMSACWKSAASRSCAGGASVGSNASMR